MREKRSVASLLIAGAVVVALASCGQARSGSLAGLGACNELGPIDGPSAESFLSGAGAWLRVDALDVKSGGDPSLQSTASFGGTFTVLGGDEEATRSIPSRLETMKLHGSIAKEIDEARTLGAEVFVHTAARNPREVAFAVAFTDDDFAFLGNCQEKLLTDPMRRRLGAEAGSRLRSAVGKPAQEMRTTLGVQEASSGGSVRILSPGSAPPELLAGLRPAIFELASLPSSWRGDYRICTHIEQGWSDCVHLGRADTATIPVSMYFNPAAPIVEVWLIAGGADLRTPTAKLAVADLSLLAKESGLSLSSGGVKLRLGLSGVVSAGQVAGDPSRAPSAVASIQLLPLD